MTDLLSLKNKKVIDVRERQELKKRYYPKNKLGKRIFSKFYSVWFNKKFFHFRKQIIKYVKHYYSKVLEVTFFSFLFVFFFRLDVTLYNYGVGFSTYMIVEELKPYVLKLFEKLGGNK